MGIKLYSTSGCSKCMLVAGIFKDKIVYESIADIAKVRYKAKELGIFEMPILDISGNTYTGKQAVMKAIEIAGEVDA